MPDNEHEVIAKLHDVGLPGVPLCFPFPWGCCSAYWHAHGPKGCERPGKRPLRRGYTELAGTLPTTQALIADYARFRERPVNLGIVVPVGYTVVEADTAEADAELEELLVGLCAPTRLPRPGRGRAYILRVPDSVCIASGAHLGKSGNIDVRGPGGILVVPPSRHQTRHAYVWAPELAPWEIEIPLAPPPLLDLLLAPRVTINANGVVVAQSSLDRPDERSLPSFEHRLVRARLYLAKMPPSIEGQNGSKACFEAALMLVRGFVLPVEEAFNVLKTDFNPRCKPPWSDRELWHKIHDVENCSRSSWGYLIVEDEGAGL